MRNILASGEINPTHSAGGDMIAIPFSFQTDGSNDPTFVVSGTTTAMKGQVSIARATNAYTLTFKFNWYETRAVVVAHTAAATINCTPTSTAASGTVTLSFSAAMTSQRVDGTIWVKPRAL